MCTSDAIDAYTTSITIANHITDCNNHMRHRNFQQHYNDQFRLSDSNWRKKLSSPNNQHQIDKNQTLATATTTLNACHTATLTVASDNWINNRRVNRKRASRHLQPIHTTHSHRQYIRTNLDVHFKWNSRIYFSISPKIYSG